MEELTLTQVADFLGVSKKKLYELVLNGDFADSLPQTAPKKWSKPDVEAWKEENFKNFF